VVLQQYLYLPSQFSKKSISVIVLNLSHCLNSLPSSKHNEDLLRRKITTQSGQKAPTANGTERRKFIYNSTKDKARQPATNLHIIFSSL